MHRLVSVCTVIMDVSATQTRLLAVRDEDPERPWDALGEWWPEQYPGVRGIRDRRAGGAWLAYDAQARRLAVLLNRADMLVADPATVLSRGNVVLEAVAGQLPEGTPHMHGFNLLVVTAGEVRVISWNGSQLRERIVEPGVHMIAHDDLDDRATPRIAAWHETFAAHPADHANWETHWIEALADTTQVHPTDDRAIIRDNRPHGYPTLSLLYCTAEVSATTASAHHVPLAVPGEWSHPAAGGAA